MAIPQDRQPLFEEFPPVSTEEWEDQIRRDLGGADYGETVLWQTRDGMTLRPYYRSEDLDRLAHVDEGAASATLSGEWTLQQNFVVREISSAEDKIRAAVDGGVERIGLELRGTPDNPSLAALLGVVSLDKVGLHVDAGLESPDLYRKLLGEINERAADSVSTNGTLGFDPLGDLARTGRLQRTTLDVASSLISQSIDAPNQFRVLRAGVETYHNAGATPVQEVALALAAVSEYLAILIERDVDGRDVLQRLYISVPVSTSFLLEIAKMRALRLLIPQLIQAYLPDEHAYQLPIHAETSFRSMTLYDPHTNLLRATTEAAAAVIGGCDVLVVHPFDAVSGESTAFSHRLARNIQHLMRHEANLGDVSDPSGGSYYVEVLTDAVARRAWAAFKEIEAQGGLIEALDDGYVQAQIHESRRQLETDVATQRRVLVGTNRYPNSQESRKESEPRPSAPSRRDGTADFEAEPLEPFRESEPFEEIRLTTDRLDIRPSILILPVGSPSVRKARANFAANLLACGGFVADVPVGYDSFEEAAEAVQETPDLLVLAAADDAYSDEVISSMKDRFPASIIAVVAPDDLQLDVDFVLHSRVNAASMLRKLQNRLHASREQSVPQS